MARSLNKKKPSKSKVLLLADVLLGNEAEILVTDDIVLPRSAHSVRLFLASALRKTNCCFVDQTYAISNGLGIACVHGGIYNIQRERNQSAVSHSTPVIMQMLAPLAICTSMTFLTAQSYTPAGSWYDTNDTYQPLSSYAGACLFRLYSEIVNVSHWRALPTFCDLLSSFLSQSSHCNFKERCFNVVQLYRWRALYQLSDKRPCMRITIMKGELRFPTDPVAFYGILGFMLHRKLVIALPASLSTFALCYVPNC